jgi:hypothetical protein
MLIVRQTIGWQRESVSLSVSDFKRMAGLAQASVVSGIKAALDHGIIERTGDKNSYTYKIIEPVSQPESVQILNRFDEPVQILNQNSSNSESESVQILNDTNIKITKQKEEEKEIVADATPPSPPVVPAKPKRSRKSQTPPDTSDVPPPREPSEWQEFVGALCWVCHGHMEVGTLTKEQKGALLAEGKAIHEQAFTVQDLKQWYKTVWGQSWQYRQSKLARPKPSDVRSSIAQLRAEIPEGFDVVVARNGNHVNGTSKVAGSLAALDDYDQIKLRHGVTT